jgi:hypothetical protein
MPPLAPFQFALSPIAVGNTSVELHGRFQRPRAIDAFQATYAAVLGNGWIVEDDQLSTADWAMMASTLANGRADSRGRVRDDRMSEQFL